MGRQNSNFLVDTYDLWKSTPDTSTMFIDEQITEDKGILLFTLDDLVETCFTKGRNFAKTYDCN